MTSSSAPRPKPSEHVIQYPTQHQIGQVEGYMRFTRGQSLTTSTMGLFTSSISQPTGRTVELQTWRVPTAEVCCYVHWLVDPRITAHILRRSTFSMMVPFSLSPWPFLLGKYQQDDAFHHFHVWVRISPGLSLVHTNGMPDQCASMSPTAR